MEPRNMVLIGQAEEIDLVLPKVREMLAREGFYVCADTARPGFEVPVVVVGGTAYSMAIDAELPPKRFLETVTISGPFRAQGSAHVSVEAEWDRDVRQLLAELITDRTVRLRFSDEAISRIERLANTSLLAAARVDGNSRCSLCHGTLQYLVDPTQPWSESAYAMCPRCVGTEAAQPESEDMVLVPRAAIQRAIETLEQDGDEHGIALNLFAMLAAATSQRGEGSK